MYLPKFFIIYFDLPPISIWAIEALLPVIVYLIAQFWRQYSKASGIFRNTVYSCLDGIYPNIESHLTLSEKDSITQESIRPINTAGAKFGHYLPLCCLYFFNKALARYCKTARETDWGKDSAINRFLNTDHGEEVPSDKFKKDISRILKFAK